MTGITLLLVPIALLIAAGFVASFVWAASEGQMDDLQTPAERVLLEEREEKRE